jgi:hypothetical protein
MRRELVYTKKDSEEIIEVPDRSLVKAISESFDFEIGFIPEGFQVAFLLIEDNKEDSRKDVWKIAFFKETVKMDQGTITIDNLQDASSGERVFDFFKVLDGNFEDVINISVDLIKKYYEEVKAANPAETVTT